MQVQKLTKILTEFLDKLGRFVKEVNLFLFNRTLYPNRPTAPFAHPLFVYHTHARTLRRSPRRLHAVRLHAVPARFGAAPVRHRQHGEPAVPPAAASCVAAAAPHVPALLPASRRGPSHFLQGMVVLHVIERCPTTGCCMDAGMVS